MQRWASNPERDPRVRRGGEEGGPVVMNEEGRSGQGHTRLEHGPLGGESPAWGRGSLGETAGEEALERGQSWSLKAEKMRDRRETETQRERERERERERKGKRKTERETERQTDRDTDGEPAHTWGGRLSPRPLKGRHPLPSSTCHPPRGASPFSSS